MTRHIWALNDRLDIADLNGSFSSLIALNGVRVTRASAQTLTTATDTKIAFDTELSDDGGFHSNVTNNTRLTVPLAGWYDFGGEVEFAAHATGYRQVKVQLNNGGFISSRIIVPGAATAFQMGLTGSRVFAAGDYIELVCYQNSGGNLNVNQAAEYTPIFYLAARRGS